MDTGTVQAIIAVPIDQQPKSGNLLKKRS